MKPAVIVDDEVIFPDGAGRKLTPYERKRHREGKLKTVKRRDARHATISGPLSYTWLP